MHINRDDIQDVTELTTDITTYIFEKLEDHDDNIYKAVLLGVFSTILVNKFKSYEAYKFIEILIEALDILDLQKNKKEEEK